MAKSKAVKMSKEMEKRLIASYIKIEKAIIGAYLKIEDSFVDNYLTKDGETVEEAKERLKKERKQTEEKNKDLF